MAEICASQLTIIRQRVAGEYFVARTANGIFKGGDSNEFGRAIGMDGLDGSGAQIQNDVRRQRAKVQRICCPAIMTWLG